MARINMVWREHRAENATTWIGQAVAPNQSAVVIVAEAGAVNVFVHAHYSYHELIRTPSEATAAGHAYAWLAEKIHLAWERAADLATIAGLAAEGLAA